MRASKPSNGSDGQTASPASGVGEWELSRGLLGTENLSREEIQWLLERGRYHQPMQSQAVKKSDALRGKTIVNLFFEPSTRTRTSFEIAAKRLGADTVSISEQGSSLSKGESLVDTLNTLAAMRPDVIVMRHSASGAPHFLSRFLKTPIVNAGDGQHEHPTQALLDAVTILDYRPSLEGLPGSDHRRTLRIAGWLARTFTCLRSLGRGLVLCGPATMLPRSLVSLAPGITLTNSIEEAVTDADVIMMLRVQLERQSVPTFPKNEYFQFYGLELDHLRLARPDAIVMHPGPINRGRELSSEVADFPRSVILHQVENGVAVRMAVLERVCGAC